jgi:hypothetical protein
MVAPLNAADGAERWLDEWSTSTAEMLARSQQLADRMGQVSVSAASQDGSVEVTVDAGGVVTGLRLGETVRKRPADELAQEILLVMRRAQAKLAGRMADITADTVGSESATGRAVVAGFERRYPAPADEDRPDPDSDASSASDWRRRGR